MANRLSALRRSIATASARTLVRGLGNGIVASVILVTRNKATYLDLTLAALERQALPLTAWDIVIVDNASKDDTSAVVEKYKHREQVRIVHHRTSDKCNFVSARNYAIEVARGHILVFLGEAHLTGADFLLQHLVHHLDIPCVVLGDGHQRVHTHVFSPLDPPPEGAFLRPMFEGEELISQPEHLEELSCDDSGGLRQMFYAHQQGHPILPKWSFFSTMNSSVPREQVAAVGSFDELFRDWGLGDDDLGYRLHLRGLPFVFEGRARTLHQLHPLNSIDEADVLHNLRHFFFKHSGLSRQDTEPFLLSKYFNSI